MMIKANVIDRFINLAHGRDRSPAVDAAKNDFPTRGPWACCNVADVIVAYRSRF
jgi:hypothetical protein